MNKQVNKTNQKKAELKRSTKVVSKAATYILITVMTICCTSFGSVGAAPAGVDLSTFNTLLDIILWIARIAIIGYVIPAGLVKIVDGRSQERPSEMNAGIVTTIICGAVFAATFIIPSLLTF